MYITFGDVIQSIITVFRRVSVKLAVFLSLARLSRGVLFLISLKFFNVNDFQG